MVVDLSSEAIVETDMQQFCVEMMKRLDIQRRNEHLCDVILEVGSGDDQARLKAHRIVLSAASPFFYNALNSEMKEKEEGVIRLKETSKAVMEEVLEHLYTGHVNINEQNACDLMAVADYFLLQSLKVLSGKVILQRLSLSNCIMAYYSAIKYRCEELQKGVRDFILANFEAVTKSENFFNLSMEQVEEWISSDEITVEGEEKVFEAILRWTEKEESRKHQNFLDLFRRIRFVYVSRDYLFKVILPHPLVRDNSECTALVLDAMKLAFDGTEECFFSQSPRNCLKSHEDAIVACGRERTLCYLPSKKNWYALADMLNEHNPFRHAVNTCHGKLYVFGAPINGGQIIAERYDPSVNQWAPTNAPDGVIERSVAVTLQGFLYVVGGRDKNNNQVSTVQRYNPDTNVWKIVPSLSSARSKVCAVADGNYLYAIGGCSPTAPFLDIVERFDPANNTWAKLSSTLVRRRYAAGAAVKRKVFVFGGFLAERTAENACEMYDPATNSWTGIPSVGAPRCMYFASAVSFKGQIFIFGDFGQTEKQEMSLQVYDVDQNQWEPCTDISFGSEFFKISRLRILRDVLAGCRVVS